MLRHACNACPRSLYVSSRDKLPHYREVSEPLSLQASGSNERISGIEGRSFGRVVVAKIEIDSQ